MCWVGSVEQARAGEEPALKHFMQGIAYDRR